MPYCTRRGKEVLVTDTYCPNRGWMAAGRTGGAATSVSISPYGALILLAFLLSFAFSYDGFRGAKSP